MTSPYTDLTTSQALDKLAQEHTKPCALCNGKGWLDRGEEEYPHADDCSLCSGKNVHHPYPNGLGDWLKEYRANDHDKAHGEGGSEWPGMVWYSPFRGIDNELRLVNEDPGTCVHALTWYEALDFLGQVCGWAHGHDTRESPSYWAKRPAASYDECEADNAAALVVAILAAEEARRAKEGFPGSGLSLHWKPDA